MSPSSSSIPEEQAVTNVPGHWLRFNDVLVDEFSLNDVAVEAECFGGTYKAKSSDGENPGVGRTREGKEGGGGGGGGGG